MRFYWFNLNNVTAPNFFSNSIQRKSIFSFNLKENNYGVIAGASRAKQSTLIKIEVRSHFAECYTIGATWDVAI